MENYTKRKLASTLVIMIHQIEAWLLGIAEQVPIEYFVTIGSAVEEIIAPIPSPLVMTLSGTLAQTQGKAVIYLLFLALAAAVSKTLASYLIYFIADKAEDVVVNKFGKFVGVSHKEIEKIGSYFAGTHKDLVIMALARAIPVIPTAPVSLVSGIIKLNVKTYLLGTLLGTIIRNVVYLLLGYYGASSAQNILDGLGSAESLIQLLLVAIGGSVLLVLFYRRKKQNDLWGSIKKLFSRN